MEVRPLPGKLHIGDVFEFRTLCGLAYLQYTHEDELLGSLGRVLEGLFAERPSDLPSVVQSHRFFVFVPVSPAAPAGDLVHVGRFDVPPEYLRAPVFRRELELDPMKHVWLLQEGEQELGRRKQLSDVERSYPLYELWDFGLLVERVGSAWSWFDEYGPIPRPDPAPASPCYAMDQ